MAQASQLDGEGGESDADGEFIRDCEMQVTLHLPSRKVDVRRPGKENSNSHGAKPVY